MMTTSPAASVGNRHCSTYAMKLWPLTGWSRTQGASMRSQRSAARKVMVRQWPYGTLALSRRPRGAQPLSGAMLVLAQVSSIKTRRLDQADPDTSSIARDDEPPWAGAVLRAARFFLKLSPPAWTHSQTCPTDRQGVVWGKG